MSNKRDIFHLVPRDYPTWGEYGVSPRTPEEMHRMLREECGVNGDATHYGWKEHYPPLMRGSLAHGYASLPGVRMHEVPMSMREHATVDSTGRVWLRVAVDPEVDDGPYER
jgi:hypothetical protein